MTESASTAELRGILILFFMLGVLLLSHWIKMKIEINGLRGVKKDPKIQKKDLISKNMGSLITKEDKTSNRTFLTVFYG